MVDEQENLSDLKMLEVGTDGHVTLLLASYLADSHRQQAGRSVGMEELRHATVGLIAAHGQYWRQTARAEGAEVELVATALERLAGLCLVERHGERVLPLPAIARYAVAEAQLLGNR